MKPRLLVTGASGFIGQHFVNRIRSYAVLRILARTTSNLTPFIDATEVEIAYGDLNTGAGLDLAVQGINTVIHCAARTYAVNYSEYYTTNTLGTKYLLDAMERNGVPNILFLSTNSASGPSTSQQGMTVHDEPQPVSQYGMTKKLAEDAVRASSLSYTILRPAPVYGPLDLDFLRYISLINKGICPIIGLGKKYLNLIYVQDLVQLMFECSIKGIFHNQTYFVHDGHCYNFKDAVQRIAHMMRKHIWIVRIPKYLALLFSVFNDVFVPREKRLINRDKIHELACRYWVSSIDNLTDDFDYRPQYDLDSGMRNTLSWYKDNGYLK